MLQNSPPHPRPPWQNLDQTVEAGTLYVVSTPIGNLADISLRALHILEQVDLIAAEDTRHTRLLLDRYGISTAMRSYHEHNALKVLPGLLDHLVSNGSLALVSDAGTPGVSDPGFRLIAAALEKGVPVVPIPGASALLAALVPSGLALDRFVFEGFLPKKKGRATRIAALSNEERTIILFESPQRLGRTLADLEVALGGDRQAVVARELTKTFEQFARGTLHELTAHYSETTARGEIVLVVEGNTKRVRRASSGGGVASEGLELDDPGGGIPVVAVGDVRQGFRRKSRKKRG